MSPDSLPALAFLLLVALVPAALADEGSPPAAAIGSRLELFVDRCLIGSMKGVEQRLHEPEPRGTVLVFDRPWEGNTSGYATVFKDGGLYRMYYRGQSDLGYLMRKATPAPGDAIVPTHAGVTCYAESRDGVSWTRPSLGLRTFNGSRDNNIVWDDEASNNFAPFRDENPAAPASERYKAVGSVDNDRRPVLVAFVSADGLRWRRLRPGPIITDGKFDSLNAVFWDGTRGRYMAVYRDFIHGVRTIRCALSADFLNWTPGRAADFGGAPEEHLYTNGAVPYFRAPQIILAMPRRFLPLRTFYPEMEALKTPGLSDGIFMSSRDGVAWNRFEEAFIRPGLDARNWVHRANTPARGIVPTGSDEISIYVERNYTFPSNRLERMTLRTDGFVSIHAGVPGGEMVTRPLLYVGGDLVLNCATAASGGIRIEIQDAAGRPIQGFRLEDAPEIFGDAVERTVDWGRTPGSRPLACLAGTPVRLRFVMRDADLYSLKFQ
jgi:hypothetical protein